MQAREAPRRILDRLFFRSEDELSEKKESVKLDEVLGEFGGKFETKYFLINALLPLEEDFHVQQEKLKQVEAETSEGDDGTLHPLALHPWLLEEVV